METTHYPGDIEDKPLEPFHRIAGISARLPYPANFFPAIFIRKRGLTRFQALLKPIKCLFPIGQHLASTRSLAHLESNRQQQEYTYLDLQVAEKMCRPIKIPHLSET